MSLCALVPATAAVVDAVAESVTYPPFKLLEGAEEVLAAALLELLLFAVNQVPVLAVEVGRISIALAWPATATSSQFVSVEVATSLIKIPLSAFFRETALATSKAKSG